MLEQRLDLDAHPRRIKVRLRVAMAAASAAVQRLGLPAALRVGATADGISALWLGPDQWLLVSDRISAIELIEKCAGALDGLSYHAADVSAAFACASVQGTGVRELLAMGSGVDWAVSQVPEGQCRRTRFARIPVVAHAVTDNVFELYYDRSYRHYLERWFAHAGSDPLTTPEPCLTTS